MDAEKMNGLRWKLVYAIEPALCCHTAPFNEPLEDKMRRMVIERDVQAKADACMDVLREFGLLTAPAPADATSKPAA